MELSKNFSTNSWQHEFKHALKSLTEVEDFFEHKFNFQIDYPIHIPRHLAAKIKAQGLEGPLAKQFLPHNFESDINGLIDPIGDQVKAKGNGIIHRYENRILFTPTTNCPVICRYCFRKNELYSETNKDIFKTNLSHLTEYLSQHPEVNEVILTGGDPLILSDKKLLSIAKEIAKTGVKYFRIHTRAPSTSPKRVDHDFCHTLNQISELFSKTIIVVHINHHTEICADVSAALKNLSKQNIDCLTQSVLLKGVNDTQDDLQSLFMALIDHNFRPYYLHHPDQVRGGMHFYLSENKGLELYNSLRSKLPGWAIPHYVVDDNQGRGKKIVKGQAN